MRIAKQTPVKHFNFIFFILMLLSLNCLSQALKTTESEGFEEPKNGRFKIIQLKNGNTLLIHIPYKKEINIKIFDPSHKLTIDKKLEPKIAAKSLGMNARVDGIFASGDDVLIFINNYIKIQPTLARIVVDGKTGDIKREDELGTLKKLWVVKPDDYELQPLKFQIKKDQYSDYYIVAQHDSQEDDINKKIALSYYSPGHDLLAKQNVVIPGSYRDLEVMDLCVNAGTKAVAVIRAGTKDHDDIYMASFDKGAKELKVTKLLEENPDLKVAKGVLKYYRKADYFYFLRSSSGRKSDKNSYSAQLEIINGNTLERIKSLSIVAPESINKKFDNYYSTHDYLKIYDRTIYLFKDNEKKIFNGIPQDFIINDNNTFTIISEEMTERTAGRFDTQFTYLINSSVVIYDDTMKELESYFIPKLQACMHLNILYMASRRALPECLNNNQGYKTIKWIPASSGNYLLINEKDKMAEDFWEPIDINAYLYTLRNNQETEKAIYSTNKDAHIAVTPFISDFNSTTSVLATLRKDANSQQIKMSWIFL